MPGDAERFLDVADQVAMDELDRRDVDRDRHVLGPGRGHEAGFAEHPFADRADQAGFLGGGDELGRA